MNFKKLPNLKPPILPEGCAPLTKKSARIIEQRAREVKAVLSVQYGFRFVSLK